MAYSGPKQSESSKDNRPVVLSGHLTSFACSTSAFGHVNQMDQSESSKGFACFDTRSCAVKWTGLVCACVNLKLRPSPSHHRKNRVLNRTSNGCRCPQNCSQIPRIGWMSDDVVFFCAACCVRICILIKKACSFVSYIIMELALAFSCEYIDLWMHLGS